MPPANPKANKASPPPASTLVPSRTPGLARIAVPIRPQFPLRVGFRRRLVNPIRLSLRKVNLTSLSGPAAVDRVRGACDGGGRITGQEHRQRADVLRAGVAGHR